MDKKEIIRLKENGLSDREVARQTGYDRGTVSKYWREYESRVKEMEEPGADVRAIQEALFSEPKYDASNRKRYKYTEELDARLKAILKEEAKKDRIFGAGHKQKLTNKQIHEKLVSEGYEISAISINIALAGIRNRPKEVFIRQKYELGERLEYDFGEVYLDCGEGIKTYHMAVLSSPGGDFRWLYLYTNQKKEVFMDSHVRFFEMMGGSYREVVYDNMRNVVSKFIGKNEKELNEDLVKMSMYYGYRINVTNCFRGNEKGYVESSVKNLRNQIFAERWTFNSLEDAQEYATSRLLKMNEHSQMEQEKARLLPYRPPLELAVIGEAKVNSSSLVSVDTVLYSVPEHLVGKRVIVKKYHDEIRIYAQNELVANGRSIGTVSNWLSSGAVASTDREIETGFRVFRKKHRRAAMTVATLLVLSIIGLNFLIVENLTTGDIMIAAHRGDSGSRRENSVESILAAIEKQTDYVELDVMATRDDVLIIHHDVTLKRLTGVDSRVDTLTYAEIVALDGDIPTLEEALVHCKGKIYVILDIKDVGRNEILVSGAVKMVEAFDMAGEVSIQSFNSSVLSLVRALNPDIRIGQIMYLASGDLSTLDVDFYTIKHSMLSTNFVRRARALDRRVWVWTVNTVGNLRDVMRYDIDGVITDYPEIAQLVRSGL